MPKTDLCDVRRQHPAVHHFVDPYHPLGYVRRQVCRFCRDLTPAQLNASHVHLLRRGSKCQYCGALAGEIYGIPVPLGDTTLSIMRRCMNLVTRLLASWPVRLLGLMRSSALRFSPTCVTCALTRFEALACATWARPIVNAYWPIVAVLGRLVSARRLWLTILTYDVAIYMTLSNAFAAGDEPLTPANLPALVRNAKGPSDLAHAYASVWSSAKDKHGLFDYRFNEDIGISL